MRVQCTGTLYVSIIPCVLAELCMSFVIEHAFCFIRKLYLMPSVHALSFVFFFYISAFFSQSLSFLIVSATWNIYGLLLSLIVILKFKKMRSTIGN